MSLINALISPVENQNDLELDFKVFSLLILVVQTLYLMNPTDATLASLSFEISKMASKMSVSKAPKMYITNVLDKEHFNFDFLWMFRC